MLRREFAIRVPLDSAAEVLCHTLRMRRRSQLIPWKVAGRVTERQANADDVVQATGWVFNSETGEQLTLASSSPPATNRSLSTSNGSGWSVMMT